MNTRVRRIFAGLATVVTLVLTSACSSSNDSSQTSAAPRAAVSSSIDGATESAPQPENKLRACDILSSKQLSKVLGNNKFGSGRNEEEASMALVMDMTYHPQMCSFGEPNFPEEVIVTTRAMYAGCNNETCLTADFKKFDKSTGRRDIGHKLPLNTIIEDSLVGVDRATLHFYKSTVEDGYCLTCEGDLTLDFMFTYSSKRYFVTVAAWARPQQMLNLASLVMHSPKIDTLV